MYFLSNYLVKARCCYLTAHALRFDDRCKLAIVFIVIKPPPARLLPVRHVGQMLLVPHWRVSEQRKELRDLSGCKIKIGDLNVKQDI